MADHRDVYIVSAVRTPIGCFQGALKSQTAVDLGVAAAKAAIERANIQPTDIQEALIGCVLQAQLGQSPARQVALRAGCPPSTDATTVNKVCASGMKCVALGAQSIRLGENEVILAGGMESMSRAPYYLQRGLMFGDASLSDAVLHDGLTDALSQQHMGQCADQSAEKHGVTRADQDAYAIQSYERAAEAWKMGKFADEIVPITVTEKRAQTVVAEDEEYHKFRPEKMSTLRPAFGQNGTVTAANASALSDGASALILASGEAVKRHGLTPLARVVSWADAACEPVDFPTAPALAMPKALERAGLTREQIALWEINEAFAVAALANAQLLHLDLARVNTRGGGVSLGHPIGSSGARIVVTLTHALQPGEFGVAGICNGGGGASAVVIQKL